MPENAEYGKYYEDKRTRRSGKLIEFNEKFKTYLFEDANGKSFNISLSQFKINWIEIKPSEIKEIVEPTVDEVKTKKSPVKKENTEPKELNELFVNSILLASKFADSFDNPLITIKPDSRKHKFKLAIRSHIVFDIDIRYRFGYCRVWLSEYDNKRVSWTVKPITTKYYPDIKRNYTTDFEMSKFPEVLEDLRGLVIDKLVELEGGIKDEI